MVLDLKNYLQFGMRFSSVIEFGPENKYTFTGSFIGLKENQYLIFELSTKAMEDLITSKINGLKIVLRGVTDTEERHVIAFRSRILGVKSIGQWLLFLEYPNKVESKPIRANKRFKVSIDARVTIGGQEYQAELLDVSVSGCAVHIHEKVSVEVGDDILVDPDMDNLPKPYPKCHIVNSREQLDGMVLGVELEQELKVSDQLKFEVLSRIFQENH